jgi:hypothetical protein
MLNSPLLQRDPAVAGFLLGTFLILALLFFTVRGMGVLILRGKQQVRWLNAFDEMVAFFKSRDGWVVIMLIILGIGLIIGIVATMLLENPSF